MNNGDNYNASIKDIEYLKRYLNDKDVIVDIRVTDLDSVKTFSTIHKLNENEKQILQDKGFRLKSVNGNFYTYEKDEETKKTVITIVPNEKYGIKCRCSNGNDIWYEPLTDEVDGWIERSPDGAIVKITIDNKLVQK